MRRYPGNHTDSELLTVPRNLKVRPNHDTTHLAYITDSEADLLQKNKPGTPHKGPQGIPNYDGGDILTYRPSGMEGTGYRGSSERQQQQQQQQYDRHQQRSNERQEQQDEINKRNQDNMKKQIKTQQLLESQGIGGMTDQQLNSMRGLFSAQAAGMDVIGYEAEINKIKRMAMSGNKAEREQAFSSLDSLTGSKENTDYILNEFGYDRSGMRTWEDVESNPFLYKSYNALLSDKTPLHKLKNALPALGYGYNTTGGGGGGYGGWGSGGGGGGYGGGGGGGVVYQEQSLPPQGVAAERWGAQNPLQQIMINTHGGERFRQGFSSGGIVSLVE